MLVRPAEVAAIRADHSDQVYLTMKSGREYEIRATLEEAELAIWGGSALGDLWDGEREQEAAP
jgi:hypothetical protein